MKFVKILRFLILGLSLTFCVNLSFGQGKYDLLLKNGYLIDPKNSINEPMDVALKDGKVAKVAKNIPEEGAKKTVDIYGYYLSPGFIDMHVHVFYGHEDNSYLANGQSAVAPDPLSFRSGVTTVVDAGSSGWKSFELFKSQTIDKSKTRVLAFLNIVGIGMKGGKWEQDKSDMDPQKSAEMAKKYDDIIVGFKLAHFNGPDWEPTDKVVKAGELSDKPVMIDFGGSTPQLSLETLFLDKLRPGDIFTHAYAELGKVRGSIADPETKKVYDYSFQAKEKGIVFDVGHGGGSFTFSQAKPAIEQGFKPDVISTDLHTGSMNAGMKDMSNVMSKFLNLGLSLSEVVDASTWKPAVYIKHQELGHLSEGALADITIFTVENGDYGFLDTAKPRKRMGGSKKLIAEATLKDGRVMYDLNALFNK